MNLFKKIVYYIENCEINFTSVCLALNFLKGNYSEVHDAAEFERQNKNPSLL